MPENFPQNKFNAVLHPATQMMLFWTLIYACYFFGPVELQPAISLKGLLFISAHLALFILGATLITRFSFLVVKPHLKINAENKIKNLVTYGMLVIGSCGIVLSIYGNLSMLEVFSFKSIAALRTLRAQDLLHAKQMHLNYFRAIGFLTYPAGFVGLVAALIDYEIIPRLLKMLLFLFMFLVYCLAMIVGGRSPILVMFLFIGATYLIRWKMNYSPMQKSMVLNFYILFLLVLFLLYSSFIWGLRSKEAGLDSSAMLQHAAQVWGAKSTARLDVLTANHPKLRQTILSTTFYGIQSLSITERLLASKKPIPLMYGAYQMDLLAALLRATKTGSIFLEKSHQALMDAQVYGYFTGAWSGLYIDLGYASLFAALLWGLISGRLWRNFQNEPSLYTGVPYVFVLYSIFISFVSAPFGFSNSLMIFIWTVLVVAILRIPRQSVYIVNRTGGSSAGAASCTNAKNSAPVVGCS